MVEEEGGDAGLGVAVDDGPVDGRCAAVLRQEGGVEVEGAEAGHGPHGFGEHSESHDNLEVGLEGTELVEKFGGLQLLGLKHGQALAQGVLLDG